MLQVTLLNPGRYLIASPRIELMEEQAQFLQEEAAKLGKSMPPLRLIHAKRSHRGDVSRQMADAARDLKDEDHCIVFITHEGLRIGDLTPFTNWHACVDEIPDSTISGSFSGAATWQYLAGVFDLKPVGDDKWSEVILRPNAPSMNEVINDDLMQPLAAFHKQVRAGQGVFVNLSDWPDAQGRGRKVQWWSLWTPLALEQCASVTITGANFETSLCHQAIKMWFSDRIELDFKSVGTDILRASSEVRIHYFTKAHTGSTTYWAESDGRWCLNQVCRYLEGIGGVNFWSGNEVVRNYFEHRFPGQMVLPKMAGTNSLIGHNSCALIYSNKAQEADEPILELFNLDKAAIRQAREIEDVIQFVMRGAIRQPDFGGIYDVYLYDIAQAEALESYLREHRITDQVTLIPVAEASILDKSRSVMKGTNTAAAIDVRSDAERKGERRAKDRDRQKKHRSKQRAATVTAGTLRPRGRPKVTRAQSCDDFEQNGGSAEAQIPI
jgi:hypothetical protein